MADPGQTQPPSRTSQGTSRDLAVHLWHCWQSGPAPDTRQLIRDAGTLSGEELIEVLLVDQGERWRRGQGLPAEEYLRWYPQLTDDPESALALVYGEYVLREELDQSPDAGEYTGRFPHFAARFEQQLALHGAIAGGESSPLVLPISDGDGPVVELPPPVVTGYELLGELGRGGMGIVYKARQLGLNRVVALKMILTGQLASAQDVRRFEVETNAAAELDHPNIVPIYEVGQDGGRHFFCMKFIGHGTLASALPRYCRDMRAGVRLMALVARAVHYAHQRGILHRDLKPANILLDAAGQPHVADFGLAKRISGAGTFTQSGALVGTPGFVAPEQARGERGASTAADVYSLGAILYALLTGRPPFQANTPLDTLLQVLEREPIPPHVLNPTADRELEAVCLKCLEKDPRRRYESAGALADELERWSRGEPISARTVGRVERFWRWCRRNPWPAAAGLLLVCLVAGTGTAAWRLREAAATSQRAERRATDQLYAALRAQAEASRGSGLPGQRVDSLTALKQAVAIARDRGLPPDERLQLRNQAIACLALPDLTTEQEWDGNPPGTVCVDFDCDFERYAVVSRSDGIRVCRRVDHRELLRIRTLPVGEQSFVIRCRFSPCGRFLAVYYKLWPERHPVEVWDISGDTARLAITLADVSSRPEFTPDERTLIASLSDGTLKLVDVATGAARDLAPGWPPNLLAISPDGRLVAVASGRPAGVQVRDLATGAVTRELRLPEDCQGLAWSPDGNLLAVACDDTRIWLWEALTGTERGFLVGHHWSVADLCFDESGRWLASFGWDMTLRIWDVGSHRQLLRVNDVRVTSFRQQGGLAAAGLVGRQVKVWAFRPSVVYAQLHGTSRHPYPLYFSPDRRWLAVRGADEEMCLWDVAAGHAAAHWPELGQPVWGPDGTWLLAGSSTGLVRLPVRYAAGERGTTATLHVGPARPVPGIGEDLRRSVLLQLGSAARRLCVRPSLDVTPYVRVVEVDEHSARELWRAPYKNCNYVVATPDGRLVAAGSIDGGDDVRVWDGSTGRPLHELATGGANPAFAADSQRFFTTTGRLTPRGAECRSWKLDTYEPVAALVLNQSTSSPAPLAVGSDGILAVAFTIDDPQLLDADSLRPIATLSAPDPRMIPWMHFSPDATMLAVASVGTVDVWDLRRLREELAELGLDWDRPPYPPAAAPSGEVKAEKSER
jgi:WD40 repeat protein